MSLVHYVACPVCSSSAISPVLSVKDYSISKEEFQIYQCYNCTLRFTQDVPDANEIAPYYKSANYISHSNTSNGLLNVIYKKVRNHTLRTKAELIKKYTLQRGAILDIGAGIGSFLNTMRVEGWQTTGIEPDEGARAQAKNLYNIELEGIDTFQSIADNSLDAITLWHVLEHVHDLHDYLNKLKSILKERGKLFIAVPNYTSKDAAFYKEFWAAYDVPRHLYHFSPQSISELLKTHNLRLIAKKPMWFDSYYISLLSSKYKNGSVNWAGAIVQGTLSNTNAIFNVNKCSSLIYIIGRD
jgi:2-polyprenyl-3-methyl-5-hydroxy-6-metoxy-1,4-benzoquinol methylase